MAFNSKHIQIDRKVEEPLKAPLPVISSTLDLSKGEIELLLVLIKDASFKGEQVETIYSLVYKLQQYYVNSK